MSAMLKSTSLDKLIEKPMREIIEACRHRDLFIQNRVASENKVRNLAVSETINRKLGEITGEMGNRVFPKAHPEARRYAEMILKPEMDSIAAYGRMETEKEREMVEALKQIRPHMPNLDRMIANTVGVSDWMFAVVLGQCGKRPDDISKVAPDLVKLPKSAKFPLFTPARFVNDYALRSRFGVACKAVAQPDGSLKWISQRKAMFDLNTKAVKEQNEGRGVNVGYSTSRRKTIWFIGANAVKGVARKSKTGTAIAPATYRALYEDKRARLVAAKTKELGRKPKLTELKGQHSRAMVEVGVQFLSDIWAACSADYKAAGATVIGR